jgi:hypothetical protein
MRISSGIIVMKLRKTSRQPRSKKKSHKKTQRRHQRGSIRWIEMPLPEFFRKHGGRDIMEGAGNYVNPKSTEECATPLTTIPYEFWDEVPLEKLQLASTPYFRYGSHNAVRGVTGTGICDDNKQLVIRYAKEAIPKYVNVKGKYVKNPKLLDFEDEMDMLIQVHGIVPDLYMCGTILEGVRGGNKFLKPFSIQERLTMSVNEVFIEYTSKEYSSYWYDILDKVMALYVDLGKRGYCNLDVKPLNTVCSFSNRRWRVKLIDLDPEFNEEFDIKRYGQDTIAILNSMVMKFCFLHHILIWIAVPAHIYGPKTITLHDVVREYLDKHIHRNPLYKLFLKVVYEYMQNDSQLARIFHHYKYVKQLNVPEIERLLATYDDDEEMDEESEVFPHLEKEESKPVARWDDAVKPSKQSKRPPIPQYDDDEEIDEETVIQKPTVKTAIRYRAVRSADKPIKWDPINPHTKKIQNKIQHSI